MATAESGAIVAMRPHPVVREIFWAHRWRIARTYVPLVLENALSLAQPVILGLAIDGLLRASFLMLLAYALVHFGHVVTGVARRAYDTRVFERVHAEVVSKVMSEQIRAGVDVSRIAARSGLSREFVEFFERQVPIVIQMSFLLIGGLAVLATFDRILVLLCLTLIIPACIVNASYARRTLVLSTQLHDALEREVDLIHQRDLAGIRAHFGRLADSRIGLSDSEARNFAAMDLFALGLIASSLVRSCLSSPAMPGEILAVLRYVLMFIAGVDGLPFLIQQICRLRDIGRRCAV
jgi:ABC transporter transmembrane region